MVSSKVKVVDAATYVPSPENLVIPGDEKFSHQSRKTRSSCTGRYGRQLSETLARKSVVFHRQRNEISRKPISGSLVVSVPGGQQGHKVLDCCMFSAGIAPSGCVIMCCMVPPRCA